ncbi:MAG: rhodanese-like domain-containing protein [Acidimicrobiia bacterium]|nr:rhodanese-like domain-containing protein [Acidimicrobiia bacterium]
MTATITPTELQRRLDDDPSVQLLDVRSGAEFESAHIPGAVNVPLDALGRVGREIADTDRTFVLVCQSGNRAGQAHTQLSAAGKEHLVVLDGGMQAWEQAHGPVNRGEAKWAMDRQVRLVAGSLVLASVVASLAVPQTKWLAGAVGAGLTWSALSNTCAMANVLGKLPYNQGAGCDVDAVVAELTAA